MVNALQVYSAPARIVSATQYAPAYPGGPFYTSLYGYGFGRGPGAVIPCTHTSPACTGTGDIQVTESNSDGSAPAAAFYDYWSDNQINVLLTPTATASGLYDLAVAPSFGEDGIAFDASPSDFPQGQSDRQSVSVTPAQPTAQITMGGTLVSGGATSTTSPSVVSVGQQIALRGTVTGLAAGVSVSSQVWAIQGTTVASYAQNLNCTSSPPTSTAVATNLAASDLAKPQVTFYWIDGDNGQNTTTYSVTYTATLSDQTTATAIAYFRPVRPSPVSFNGVITTTTPVINVGSGMLTQGGNPVTSLNFGYPGPDYGIQFTATLTTTYGGQVALIQLVNTTHTVTLASGTQGVQASNGYVLDDPRSGTVPQYGGAKGVITFPPVTSAQVPWTDATAVSLQGATAATTNDQFQTYLMYQPPGAGSIWVTLQMLTWSWSGSASQANGAWALGPNNTFSPSPAGASTTGTSSTTLPQWSGAVSFLVYKAQ